MSNIIYSIRELMRDLNLNNVALPDFKLKEDEGMSNLEYLEFVLREEQQMRAIKKNERRLRQGHIPPMSYDKNIEGINKEQLRRILTLGFTESHVNIIIIGQCRTGKTALTATLGESFVIRGKRVYYIKIYDLLDILFTRNESPAAKRKYEYMISGDMVIIDEFLYTKITTDELTVLFRFISLINDLVSIVIVTNRYFDEWLDASEDEFLMQTMIERLLGDCEIFKTQTLQSSLLPSRTPKKKKQSNKN